MAVGAVIAILVAAGVAVYLKRVADDRAKVAFSRQLAAQATSHINRELDLALLLSLESFRAEKTTEACSAFLTALHSNPKLIAMLHRGSPVDNLQYMPESNVLAAGGQDGKVLLWDLSDPRAPRSLGELPQGHQHGVSGLAYLPNRRILASSEEDPSGGQVETVILLWDLSDPRAPKPPGKLAHGQGHVTSLAFMPESSVLASGDWTGHVLFWDVSELEAPKPLGGLSTGARGEGLTSVAFIPGSKVMASWGSDNLGTRDATKILLWDVSGAREPRSLGELPSGHPGGMSGVTFVPERQVMVSWGQDGKILLRDLSDPRAPRSLGTPLPSYPNNVRGLVFMLEGKVMVSWGQDGKILLWDVSDPRAPKSLGDLPSGHPNGVSGLVFVPERNVLASWGSNAARDRDDILLWQMDWVALQTEACRIVNRDLTDVEWRQYLGSYYGEKRTHETCADILGADVQLRGKQDTTRQQKQ